MKNLRKIIALLIAVITVIGVFAIPATVNAADADETEEPIVARMYLGHKPRNYNMSGHTWIYIENLTNHDIPDGGIHPLVGFDLLAENGQGLYIFFIGDVGQVHELLIDPFSVEIHGVYLLRTGSGNAYRYRRSDAGH